MITNEDRRDEYVASGGTTFPYTFKIFDAAHLDVYVDGALQSSGYGVSGVGNDGGGNVVFGVAPAAGLVVILLANTPATQLTDYAPLTKFPETAHEDALDKLTNLVIEAREMIGRAPAFAPASTFNGVTFPELVASYYLRANLAGTGLEFVAVALADLGEFLQSGTGAVVRTVQSKLGDIVSVMDFGAVGDGSADDTAAFQAAIDYVESLGGGQLWMPHLTFKITDTLVIGNDRVTLTGAGKQATIILFAPTANNTPCFHFTKGASVLFQGGLEHFGIQTSGTATGKIGIQLSDTSEINLHDLAVLMETNQASVGIKLRGREFTRLDTIESRACSPLIIGNNPNFTIDCDHLSVHNFYGLAPAGSFDIITVEDGVNATNLTFSGYQSWVGGRDGFRFISSGAASDLNLAFHNVRREQESGGLMFRFERTTGFVRGLLFQNCEGGTSGEGWKLRNCVGVTFISNHWLRTAGVALDLDTTDSEIAVLDFSFNTGSTISIGALVPHFLVMSSAGETIISAVYSSSAAPGVALGITPAAAGALRLANDATIRARNAANSADVQIVKVGTNDAVQLNPGGANDIQWGKALVALGGGAAATLGTIGGSGPATAGQNTWMRVLDSGGNAFWVPVWK